MGYAIKFCVLLVFLSIFLPEGQLGRWFGPIFARYAALVSACFKPLGLWQRSPEEYPRWAVPLLWAWAQRNPKRFDPRHPEGPRARQDFKVFDNHSVCIGDWVFYAASKDDIWFLEWWPTWLMESRILQNVVCSTLWERGAVFVWEHTNEKTAEALFGDAMGNHPQFGAFLRAHPHAGLSQVETKAWYRWTPEMLHWIVEGYLERVQSWIDEHQRHPRSAWEYLGDLSLFNLQKGSGFTVFDYFFSLELWQAQCFDEFFPLEKSWSWAKVLSLYGVDTMGLAASVADWSQETQATIDAGHICHHDGHSVAAGVLGQAVGWELDLLLGNPDWKTWTGMQRVNAILGPQGTQESLPISGLV